MTKLFLKLVCMLLSVCNNDEMRPLLITLTVRSLISRFWHSYGCVKPLKPLKVLFNKVWLWENNFCLWVYSHSTHYSSKYMYNLKNSIMNSSYSGAHVFILTVGSSITWWMHACLLIQVCTNDLEWSCTGTALSRPQPDITDLM